MATSATSVFNTGVGEFQSDEENQEHSSFFSMEKAQEMKHLSELLHLTGASEEERNFIKTLHANKEELYTNPEKAKEVQKYLKGKNRLQKNALGQDLVAELSQTVETSLRIHQEIEQNEEFSTYRKERDDLQKARWKALEKEQAELLKTHGIVATPEEGQAKAQKIIEETRKAVEKDPSLNVDDAVIDASKKITGKTTDAYQSATRVWTDRVNEQFSSQGQKVVEQGTNAVITRVLKEGLPDQANEFLKTYKPKDGKEHPLEEIARRLKGGEVVKFEDVITTLKGHGVILENLTPAQIEKINKSLNTSSQIITTNYEVTLKSPSTIVVPETSPIIPSTNQTSTTSPSIIKTPISPPPVPSTPSTSQDQKQSYSIPTPAPASIPIPAETKPETATVLSATEEQKPKSPQTAKEFEQSVVEDVKKQLAETETEIRKRQAAVKKDGGFMTAAKKKELERLEHAQAVVTKTQRSLENPKHRKKISSLVSQNPEELLRRPKILHQAILNKKEIHSLLLDPNKWLFAKMKSRSTTPPLPKGMGAKIPVFSFPHLPFFPSFSRINLSGLLGRFSRGLNINRLLRIGRVSFLRSGVGRIFRRVLSSALIKGLGGALTGGVLTALSILSDILSLFGINIGDKITTVALVAVFAVVGLFIMMILLPILAVTNFGGVGG